MTYALKARLAAAKTKAAENAATQARQLESYPGAHPNYLAQWPTDWRAVARANAKRRYARPAIWNPSYTDSKGRVWRWLERVDGSGLRVAIENATAEATRHIGYYTDSDCGDSIHGVVLSTRDPESPKARFFAAVSDPHNAGAYRILWEAESDLRAAINEADRLAERSAEEERAYNAAFHAGSQWADLGAEIAEARKSALAILRDRKTARGSDTLCAVIREKVESLLSDIRKAREQRESLAEGDGLPGRESWGLSFYTGDKGLRAAFNDGAGAEVLA
jgi:hypothetical protein